MSARKNPFEEIERFFERMSRQFDAASGQWESSEPTGWWSSEPEAIPIDVVERDDQFLAMVDLPGFTADEVDVRVTDHTLRIEAEREERVDEEGGDYVRRERRHETSSRSIDLPAELDTESVTAELKHGVLTITIPKVETERALGCPGGDSETAPTVLDGVCGRR